MLFPELDQQVSTTEVDSDYETGVRAHNHDEVVEITEPSVAAQWFNTQDVWHPEYGHGWVQGAGHGIVSVRFETRTTERGITRTFPDDDPDLIAADPLNSLEWADWFEKQI